MAVANKQITVPPRHPPSRGIALGSCCKCKCLFTLWVLYSEDLIPG